MIPLRDINPHRTFPIVNYVLIGVNVIIFLLQISLGKSYEAAIYQFGLVPVRLMNDVQMFDFGLMTVLPVFSSMFMHGGWMHLIGNMLFLHVFGDNIEDRLGHIRYIFFYLLAGVGGAAGQIIINPISAIPMVGASGAIAGVLGAYILMFPRAKILTLIPIFFFIQFVELPAFLFLGIWFLMQLLSGTLSLGIGGDAGGVAWWAHIGGFVAGATLLFVFRKRK
ncbi:MAG: rhomboid family intramembrane serine protease [Bacteroidota bacterium]|nr:rhomboid family intramembrane serine protease [Bacteroidota bacterium]